MKMILKRVGQPLEIVETKERYRTKAVKQFLPGAETQQKVYLDENTTFSMMMDEDGLYKAFSMVVDEDGLYKEVPLNFFMKMESLAYPVQAIIRVVGDVVFVRTKYANPYKEKLRDYEVEDVTAADIEKVKRFLDERLQARLKAEYMKRR